MELAVPGVLAESADEFVELSRPMREENRRARESPGVVSTVDRAELSLGAIVTDLGRSVAGVELPDDRLDGVSRRVAIRSARDRCTAALRSEILGEALTAPELDGVPAPIRLPISLVAFDPRLVLADDGKDLSLNELRVSGVIILPIERSLCAGV